MSYQAILFDMDGVIVDTNQAVTDFWQKWSQVHQVRLSQTDFQQHIYGCPATHTLDLLFPALDADQRDQIIADMTAYEINQRYTAVTGVIPFLEELKRNNIPKALVTSGEQWKVTAVLTQLGLNGTFDATVTVADIKQGKPNPDCYLLGAAHLQVEPEKCIVFEDAVSGVKAAVAAGALCIGVQPGQPTPLLEAGAQFVVPDFSPVTLQVNLSEGVEPVVDLRFGSVSSLRLRPEATAT
jgi:HAD superfamily hydrolase (TIGR01509 family)